MFNISGTHMVYISAVFKLLYSIGKVQPYTSTSFFYMVMLFPLNNINNFVFYLLIHFFKFSVSINHYKII